jgi:CRISPR-associated endonuclease Cas2
MAPKSPEIRLIERVRLIQKAGIESPRRLRKFLPEDLSGFEGLDSRIETITRLLRTHRPTTPATHMLFFIMYDIEHNKIRTHIAKYLLRKGCHRVQKSIFLAQLTRKTYEEIHQTLKEIQETYDNHDSIFLVPIAEDELRAMRVVGKNLDFELITDKKNTLFF